MVECNGEKGSHRFAISHTCIVNSFVRKDCGDGWKAQIMSGHSEHEMIVGGWRWRWKLRVGELGCAMEWVVLLCLEVGRGA